MRRASIRARKCTLLIIDESGSGCASPRAPIATVWVSAADRTSVALAPLQSWPRERSDSAARPTGSRAHPRGVRHNRGERRLEHSHQPAVGRPGPDESGRSTGERLIPSFVGVGTSEEGVPREPCGDGLGRRVGQRMAGTQGFEPRLDGPEPPVLPLNDVPTMVVPLIISTGECAGQRRSTAAPLAAAPTAS